MLINYNWFYELENCYLFNELDNYSQYHELENSFLLRELINVHFFQFPKRILRPDVCSFLSLISWIPPKNCPSLLHIRIITLPFNTIWKGRMGKQLHFWAVYNNKRLEIMIMKNKILTVLIFSILIWFLINFSNRPVSWHH